VERSIELSGGNGNFSFDDERRGENLRRKRRNRSVRASCSSPSSSSSDYYCDYYCDYYGCYCCCCVESHEMGPVTQKEVEEEQEEKV